MTAENDISDLKTKNSKHGVSSFGSLGLQANLVKAIQKKGYKQPTPVQRKCIPLLLSGKDVIGMARTGSGKTAAFILPILQKLKIHSAKTGVRALILAPSRELALQTLKFTQQMSKFTDLRVAALIGGDGLEEQFASLASNPDIVVATPGRLLHVCVEAGINLKTVELVVWDEADRLVEDASMGEQLKDIMARCPASRQTALFSATMPQALADFARAGLSDPALVKLDAESKLSPDLKTIFLSIKTETRDAHLINILMQHCYVPNRKFPMTVIFAATKHHVEYLQELLSSLNLPVTYIYGSLDQSARESAIEMFRSGRKRILIVTDVASRGIDVPLLDIVVNYDFPATPKLFVHRVGRVARAGRKGTAYSLVAPDELPYLVDLQLFLERPVVLAKPGLENSNDEILLASLRQDDIDHETERLRTILSLNGTISSLKDVVINAYKLYKRTRTSASAESHRRAKELTSGTPVIALHPDLYQQDNTEVNCMEMLSAIKLFKPKQSFLEMTNATASKSAPTESRKRKVEKNEDRPVKSYKDEQNYLSYDRDKKSGNDQLSFGQLSPDCIFDINAVKRDDLIKVGKMLSTKLRKQGSSGNQVKMMKTEFGTSVPASYKSGNYEKWCAKTRLSIPRPGEVESEETSSRAKSIVNDGLNKKKWRKPVSKFSGKKNHTRK